MFTVIGLITIVTIVILLTIKPTRRPPVGSSNKIDISSGTNTYDAGFQAAIDEVKLLLDSNLSEYDKAKLNLQLDRLVTERRNANIKVPEPSAPEPSVVMISEVDNSSKPVSVDDSSSTLNIILFIASILVIASVSSFIASFGSPSMQLMVVWVVAAVFYVGGIILHQLIERLRPAALAFVGIGMVMIPLAGMLMHSTGLMSGVESAIVTSSIAVALYLLAATILRNEIVAGVSILSLVSLVVSLGQGLDAPYVLVFSLILGISILMQLIEAVFKGSIPKYYVRPVSYSIKFLPVVTLVASLPFAAKLSLIDFEVLVALATVQYGIYFSRTKSYAFETVMRAGIGVLIILLTTDIASRLDHDNFYATGIGWVLAATVTVCYGLFRLKSYSNREKNIELMIFAAMSFVWWSTILSWTVIKSNNILSIEVLAVVVMLSIWARIVMQKQVIMYQVGLAAVVALAIGLSMANAPDYMSVISYLALGAVSGTLFAIYSKIGDRKYYLVAPMTAALFIGLIYALGIGTDSWWVAFVFMVSTLASLMLFIKIKRIELMYVGMGLLWLSVSIALYRAFDGNLAFGSTMTVAALLEGLCLYITREWSSKTDNLLSKYSQETLVSVLVMFGLASWMIVNTGSEAVGIRALHGISSILFAAACVRDCMIRKSTGYGESGAYALALGMMQIIWVADTGRDVNWLVYLHIVALAVYGAAWVYRSNYAARLVRLKVATGILTVFLGFASLIGDSWYQVVFFAEHITMLMVAVLFGQKWLRTWAAIALILGVMYALRDLSYLFMLAAGIGLITYVLWRLGRQQSK